MRARRFFPKWKRVFDYIRDPKSDWKPKALFLLALIYVAFPFDLLPDILPVIGWLDDLGMFAFASWYLWRVGAFYGQKMKRG